MKTYDTLLPNGMSCHHHMEDQVKLLITKDNNIVRKLINESYSSNQ
jgi:hypothetical protein